MVRERDRDRNRKKKANLSRLPRISRTPTHKKIVCIYIYTYTDEQRIIFGKKSITKK